MLNYVKKISKQQIILIDSKKSLLRIFHLFFNLICINMNLCQSEGNDLADSAEYLAWGACTIGRWTDKLNFLRNKKQLICSTLSTVNEKQNRVD